MASKPIIKPITPFDASKGVTIEAQYSGSLPFHNRVEIFDATNLVKVYARTIATSDYSHFVDPTYKGSIVASGDTPYSLENGKRYLATIQFFGKDVSTEIGLVSDKQSFLTRTTAEFYFIGLSTGGEANVIDTSTIYLTLNYTQAEFDKLLNYKFEIYSSGHILLQETPIMYDTTDLSYSFKGLENMETYYVRAEGTTSSGVHLDTRDSKGRDVRISTQYENPSVYARMLITNDPQTSEMNYKTNFIFIESEEEENTFQYENDWVHLENGETCTYSSGFHIDSDATFFMRVRQVQYSVPFFECWGEDGRIDVYAVPEYDGTRTTILLTVYDLDDNPIQRVYSDFFNIDWIADACNIWIRKIGNTYTLTVTVESNVISWGDVYVGLESPLDRAETKDVIQPNDVWVTNMPIRGVRMVPEENIYYQQEVPTDAPQYSIWVSQGYTEIIHEYDPYAPEQGGTEGGDIGDNGEPIPGGSGSDSVDPDDPSSNTEQGNTEGGQTGDNGEPEPGSGGDSVEPDGPSGDDVEQGGTDSPGQTGDNGEPEPGSGSDSVDP